MSARPMLEPGPDHPITIEPHGGRVRVTAGDRTLVDTDGAYVLQEADYPPVLYLPLADADQGQLQRTDHSTYCPYKGDAGYYSIPALGEAGENAVWEYRDPRPAVARIKDTIAFYPDRVQITES